MRNFGAKGNGVTSDTAAIQAALNAAKPGDAVYFPAGTYLLSDRIAVYQSNITLWGDGPTSVLQSSIGTALRLGGGGPLTGLVVKQLKFRGQPGKYMLDGNNGLAIEVYGPKGTVIDNCDFQGCGYCVYDGGDTGTTYGTKIQNCRVNGWGTVAIFCNGGEQITNCSLVQDDPNLNGARSSHGIYIHSGCTDVLVQDTLIENVRKYGAQVWGKVTDTVTSGVTFERVTFRNCLSALTIQQLTPDTARAKGILIENCSFFNSYGGPALSIKQGDGD